MEFNLLNDDCILKIFSNLSFSNILIAKQVCLKWKTLIEISWKRIRKLDFDSLVKNECLVITVNILDDVLSQCGNILEEFILSNKAIDKLFLKAYKHFPELSSQLILCIAKHCCNLKKITLWYTEGVSDVSFSALFSRNTNLESFIMFGNNVITGECFKTLLSIKELKLRNCQVLDISLLLKNMQKRPALDSLYLDGSKNLPPHLLIDLARHVPNLRKLSLNSIYIVNLAAIGNFKDLRYLSLSLNTKVNDEVLKIISQSCRKIEVLVIDVDYNIDYENITEVGLSYLSHLPNLNALSLNYIRSVNAETIKDIARKGILKALSIICCESFDDEGALEILRHCKQLIYFDMLWIPNITENTVKYAVQELNIEPNRKKPLVLGLGGTNVEHSNKEISELPAHPFLYLSFDINHKYDYLFE